MTLRRRLLSALALATVACGACVGARAPEPVPADAGLVTPAADAAATAPEASAPTTIDAGAPTDRPLHALPYTPSLDRDAMDPTADPCVSLYQYSCGGWMKKNPIPPDQTAWSVYAKLGDDNRHYLWGILEELAQKSSRTPAEQKLGDYFAACMDEAAINRRGAAPLNASLAAIEAMTKPAELAAVLARLQLENADQSEILFGFAEQQDFEDSQKMVVSANAGGLGLPDRDYYTKTDEHSRQIVAKYTSHVTKMLALSGEDPTTAERHAKDVVALETRLAEASLTRTQKRDPKKLFHRTPVTKLAADVPGFDWKTYFAAMGLGSLTSLNVSEPEFFKRVALLLGTVPVADWKAYLRWHLVHDKAAFLSSEFVNEHFDFYSHTLRGAVSIKPRWKRCVSFVDDQLGEALGQEFVRRTFSPDTRAKVEEMTRFIKKSMEETLQAESWMGPATKREALAKPAAMVDKIGYPERARDYGSVTIDRGDFVGNVDRAQLFESKRRMAKVGRPVDRSEWYMTAPTVNAYYDPQMNDMNFPAGVLIPPLFDPKMDDAPNYGNTGATIGHELTHGFDDEGRQFDSKGNLRDFWTKSDADQFVARAKCVVDQYGKYTIVDDIKINSEMTQGEDIADLGGTMLALLAWRKAVAGKTLAPIDGLTPDQRFWIGMAQWTCENQRPENLRNDALTNAHSPGRYRIDGVAANFADFEKAFSCKSGQPMAPAHRCKVW